MASVSAKTLANQFKELTKQPIPGFRVSLRNDSMFEWDVIIFGPPSSLYQDGYFKAILKFPQDYPFSPPKFEFETKIYHPNVYPDGKICISILHDAGHDEMSGERPEERWNPTRSIESILISIIALLSDPNCDSPANVDAAVMYRTKRDEYQKIVKEYIEKSKKDIPKNFVMPTADEWNMKGKVESEVEDNSFWYESGNDDGEDYDNDYTDSEADLDDEPIDLSEEEDE